MDIISVKEQTEDSCGYKIKDGSCHNATKDLEDELPLEDTDTEVHRRLRCNFFIGVNF